MTSPFADHVFESVVHAFRRVPSEQRDDIYVLSLFVYDEEDDPRRPTVTPGYNTESQVASPSATSKARRSEDRLSQQRMDAVVTAGAA